MVVSGINHGPNLGDDVLYSGTVAAAMEGRFLGLPALAISLAAGEGRHFDTAGRVAREIVNRLTDKPLPNDSILNINVPNVPYDELQGFEATRLGYRHRAEPVVPATDPRGRRIFWVGAAGAKADAGPGTDFHALANTRVSVTPLQVDLTRHVEIPHLKSWLEEPMGS